MPGLGTNLSLSLKTATPATPSISFTNGPILSGSTNFNSIPMTLSHSIVDSNTVEMLIYGCKGNTSKSFTADGTQTTFTYEATASDVASTAAEIIVKVNGEIPVVAPDCTTIGQVTFTTAPDEDDVVEVFYVKKVLTSSDASWEAFAVSKNIALDQTTVETAGTATVYLLVRDDVHNVSLAGSATATVDTAVPTVDIKSIVLGDGSYITNPQYKISKVAGRDTIIIVFQVDEQIQAWKAMVVDSASDAHDAATNTQIPNTAGSMASASGITVAADTNITCTIKGTDYETAVTTDGAYIVKIFAQDAAGNWST